MSKNDSILGVIDILNEYSNDIQEAMQVDAEETAKMGADKLKTTSPKNTGKYARGWKVKTIKRKGYVSSTIHNTTNWQLTHLLEKPHTIRNKYGEWGTSKPQVHIKPVEEECIKEYQRKIENTIKNGG